MGRRGVWPSTGFGARLRELRLQAGLSQEQLAQQAGCTVAMVSRYERGEHEPAWPLVLAVARVLGVSSQDFEPVRKKDEKS
jgi:transcriptional regulator with XRE-family HTH domain